MSGAHAKFSPSGEHRWLECYGSMLLEEGITDTSSEFADLGTAAHHLHAYCLTHHTNTKEYLGRKIWVTDESSGWVSDAIVHGTRVFEVDENMAQAVQASLIEVRARSTEGTLVLIEQRLSLKRLTGIDGQFGTGDVGIANFESKNLWIGDYKHGTGEMVFALKNHQMMAYASGWVEMLEMTGFEPETITLCVLQPRQDHIDEVTITMAELIAFEERTREAVKVISALTLEEVMRNVNPKGEETELRRLAPYGYLHLHPEKPKTCTWCKAQATCPALAAKVAEETMNDFTAINEGHAILMATIPPSAYDDEALGRKFTVLDQISSWCKAVKVETDRRVFAGAVIMGADGKPLKIVAGKKGNRGWADETGAAGALMEVLDPEKVYTQTIIGVTKAEELVGKAKFKKLTSGGDPEKGIEPGVLFGHISQADGGPTVALGSDKRPAIGADKALEGTAAEFAAVVDLAS